ncbi:MAG: hypothetical protein N2D54_01670 [Chloroflexota bacterium]
MKNNHLLNGLMIISMTILMASCSSSTSPTVVVEQYIESMVAKDDIATVNLSCSSWEANAKADGASFEGVEVSLEDMACSVVSEDSDNAVVSCTGQFVFQYAGGENEEIGLDSRNYSMVKQAGEWKMCGYE